MKTTLHRVVHGRTIELAEESGLPDGQAVTVEIEPVAAAKPKHALPVDAPPPWWLGRLEVNPAVALGRFVVKGTSLQAEALGALLEEGRTEQELLNLHPELTAEDVAAVREYAKVPDGLRRSFGAWAEDAEELDEFLQWSRHQRTA
jgi:uncharacterized protein (DUF433 family)